MGNFHWKINIMHPTDRSEFYRIILTDKNRNQTYSYPYFTLKKMLEEDRIFEIPNLEVSQENTMKSKVEKAINYISQRLL